MVISTYYAKICNKLLPVNLFSVNDCFYNYPGSFTEQESQIRMLVFFINIRRDKTMRAE